jgi:hypothetical protein
MRRVFPAALLAFVDRHRSLTRFEAVGKMMCPEQENIFSTGCILFIETEY